MQRLFKPAVFLLCLVPLLRLIWVGHSQGLGPNPPETVIHSTGWWALALLALTLCVTPLARWTGRPLVTRVRRMLGLYAFFYTLLHLIAWLAFDEDLALATAWHEILDHPFLWTGALSIVLMLPLALTSTNGWVRRLGRNWRRLHWLVHPAAAFAAIHFCLEVKRDIREPFLFLLAFIVLWCIRLFRWRVRAAQDRQALAIEESS